MGSWQFLDALAGQLADEVHVAAAAVLLADDTGELRLAGCSEPGRTTRVLLEADARAGPADTAHRVGQPVSPPDLNAAHSWWPGTRMLSEVTGLRTVHAHPLVAGSQRLGVLLLLDLHDGRVTDWQTARAKAWAIKILAEVAFDSGLKSSPATTWAPITEGNAHLG